MDVFIGWIEGLLAVMLLILYRGSEGGGTSNTTAYINHTNLTLKLY